METNVANPAETRLQRLLQYLDSDPGNIRLLEDAAVAAYEARDADLAAGLIERRAGQGDLPPPMTNLKGLVAMARQRYDEAVTAFDTLLAGNNDPALRFNLAWCKAMQGAFAEAAELLDDASIAMSPRGPALKIVVLHHLQRYDEALAEGEKLAGQYPTNEPLMGALATLAIDAERIDLAAAYAARAGDHTEGQTVLGLLALAEQKAEESQEYFDHALAKQPDNARALVGKGLGLLASGAIDAGTEVIDRGAEIFGNHLGTWVASGWAHFLRGDYAKARASFERAESIDKAFAEIHGGLAVIAIMENNETEARRRCETAFRLDSRCFGATLAHVMLLDKHGHAAGAAKIRSMALSAPIGPNGQTLAQALMALAARRKS